MNLWTRTALLILVAGAPACSLKKAPASTPFANRQIVEELKALQKALGFEDTKVNYHVQRFAGKRKPLFTVVGRRTVPLSD